MAFIEQSGIPLARQSDGSISPTIGYATVKWVAFGRELSVVSITTRSDPGITADYLGYSQCKRTCVGAAAEGQDINSQDPATLAAASLDGRFPAPVPVMSASGQMYGVVFRIAISQYAIANLQKDPCLGMIDVQVTFADGSSAVVSEQDSAEHHVLFFHPYSPGAPSVPAAAC